MFLDFHGKQTYQFDNVCALRPICNTASEKMRGFLRSDKVLLPSFSFNGLIKLSSGNPHSS